MHQKQAELRTEEQSKVDEQERTLDALCRSVKAGDLEVSLGDIVAVMPCDEDSSDEALVQMGMIQALWQTPKAKMMQVIDHSCSSAHSFELPSTHEDGECVRVQYLLKICAAMMTDCMGLGKGQCQGPCLSSQ